MTDHAVETPTIGRRAALLSMIAISLAGCSGPERTKGSLDPRDFGAAGNGIRDDTDALKRCMTAAKTSGQSIALGGLTYLVHNLNLTGVTVHGRGGMFAQHRAAQRSRPFLIAEPPFALHELRIRAREASAALHVGVDGSGAGEAVVNNVSITGAADIGLLLRGGNKTALHAAVRVTGLEVSRAKRSGVFIAGCSDISLSGLKVVGSASHGCVIQESRDITVDDSFLRGSGGHGLVVQYAQDITLRGVEASGSHRTGLTVGGGNPDRPTAKRVHIEDCTSTGNAEHGIAYDITLRGQPGTPLSLQGRASRNVCRDNGLDGIAVTCSADLTIEHNEITGNRRNGIAVSSARVTIRSNRVQANARYGVALYGGGSARHHYGEHVLDSNTIVGNSLGNLKTATSSLLRINAGNRIG